MFLTFSRFANARRCRCCFCRCAHTFGCVSNSNFIPFYIHFFKCVLRVFYHRRHRLHEFALWTRFQVPTDRVYRPHIAIWFSTLYCCLSCFMLDFSVFPYFMRKHIFDRLHANANELAHCDSWHFCIGTTQKFVFFMLPHQARLECFSFVLRRFIDEWVRRLSR